MDHIATFGQMSHYFPTGMFALADPMSHVSNAAFAEIGSTQARLIFG